LKHRLNFISDFASVIFHPKDDLLYQYKYFSMYIRLLLFLHGYFRKALISFIVRGISNGSRELEAAVHLEECYVLGENT
jgi:hypothetical protein